MSQMQPRLREYLAKLRQNAYTMCVPAMWIRRRYKTPPSRSTAPTRLPDRRRRCISSAAGIPARIVDGTPATATRRRPIPGTKTTTRRGEPAGTTAATATTATPARRPQRTTAAGTTTGLANTPAVEKPGKKEKIRFGQAPREALPPAAHPTNGLRTGCRDGSGRRQRVAGSVEFQLHGCPRRRNVAATVERKTRLSDRAREPKAKKAKTPDQVENERVAAAGDAGRERRRRRRSPLRWVWLAIPLPRRRRPR